MKKATRKDDKMRNHYDFTGGVRGKYALRYAEGSNVVVLDPDVARLFPTGQAVNETLRAVVQIVRIQERRRDRSNKALAAHRRASADRKERERSRSGAGK